MPPLPHPPTGSASPVFTGARLDRAANLRADPAQLDRLLDDPRAVVVAAAGDGVLVEPPDGERLARRPLGGAPARFLGADGPVLLGVEAGAPLFAADLDALDPSVREELGAGGKVVPLREAGAHLPQAEGGLAAYLVALLAWHRRHRFCANCGAETGLVQGGLARRCARCGASHFPRTDPVVIMLVEHEGRLLLGRRPGWPAGRYSLLAGFVSAGETPEEAVIREVREESGIVCRGPRYIASQPWPFPASLMLGFEARSDGGTPRVVDGELEDVRWVGLAEVRQARDGEGELALPPSVAIARILIDRWLDARS